MGLKGAALITGASARIGLAVARRLAEAGFAVVLHASPRSLAAAEREAHLLEDAGMKARAIGADLSDAEACRRLVGEAAGVFGSLRLLVNNAAIFQPDAADALDLAVWDRQFSINLRAPVLLASAFVAQAPEGEDCSVVNLVDQRVLRPTPRAFSYTLTKSALWAATQTMAQTFAARGVRVNAIGPGPVLPNANEGEAGFLREVAGVPLGHAVATQEIAEAILYLVGARSVTGQFLAIDSGQHLGWRTPDFEG